MSEPGGGWEFASPLQLLADEAAYGDQQTEEALLLSFTVDLGFLESFMLGPAQVLGARVTVVSDARMCAPDPRAARSAGIHYLSGLAACAGAFHPKLVVLAGRQRATVAIGSGNATLSGWQANRELWTVLRSTETAAPAVFADLATWLRELPKAARFGHLVPEALTRTALLLEKHLSRTSVAVDVRFASSLETPIIDQLPTNRVDELAVYAPFHDPGAHALRALVERFNPARLKVAFQPGLTQLDGPAVAALVERFSGELVSDGETERYRHGKLIEWAVGDQRWCLTGSPNLSGAALLRTMRNGGNCEIALIAPITRSRMPGGSVAASATVRSLFTLPARTEPKEQEPILLSATLTSAGSLSLVLAAAAAHPVTVQASARHQDPDDWDELGVIPVGRSDIQFATNLTAGSRVRLITSGSASRIVFLTDPGSVQLRPLSSAGQARTATRFEDFFADPLLAERFAQELAELRLKLPGRTPGATHAPAEVSDQRTRAPHIGWRAYLNAAKHVNGDQLVAFALGLPHVHLTTHYDKSSPEWDESFTLESAIDETSETGESRVEDEPEYFVPPDFSKATQRLRRRYQRWAAQLVIAATELQDEPVLKLAAVRLLLTLMAARVWESNDDDWSRLLCAALDTLGESADTDLDRVLVGSVAAVALSAMKSCTPDAASGRTVQAVRKLLAHAEEALIVEYVIPLREFYSDAVDPTVVLDYAQYIAARDDIDDVLSALRIRHFTAHRHGRLVHLVKCRNETRAALEAIGVMGDGQVSGVWASGDGGRWSLIAWRKPDLMEVRCYGAGKAVQRRQFRLTGPATPGSLAADDNGLSGRKPQHPPSPGFFGEMLGALGLTEPAPPTGCDSGTSQSSDEKATT